MATNNSTVLVSGTDGVTPVYNPDGLWQWWALAQIYLGREGSNKYVPKVGDYVMDTSNYTAYEVDALDPVTLVPTLKEKRPGNMSGTFSQDDILFGRGPGTQSDTYLMYLDKSTTPYTAVVDQRLEINGSLCSYVKVFRGLAELGLGTVISKVFDTAGQLISQDVALEVTAIDTHTNFTKKVVKQFKVTEGLDDGEIVTVVAYSDNGVVVSKRQLKVENTAFIRDLVGSKRYVTNIALVTPYLSTTNELTIEFPLNVPLSALNLVGRVYYSDGSWVDYPANGQKFQVYGLDQYVSSIPGQKVPVVASYTLGTNEASNAGVNTQAGAVTKNYDMVTVSSNNSYAVKLFGYPRWLGDAQGYEMAWYLLNLERNLYYDVSAQVQFSEATGGFNPKLYGVVQEKQVSLDLRAVSGAYKPFVHTQLFTATLNGRPGEVINPWIVHDTSLDPGSQTTMPGVPTSFGDGVFAKIVSANQIRVDFNSPSQAEWLSRLYYATGPLVDRASEVQPPAPTHFVLMYSGLESVYHIDQWNQVVALPATATANSLLLIRFMLQTPNGNLNLSVAGAIIKP